jgi:hypothetical protein
MPASEVVHPELARLAAREGESTPANGCAKKRIAIETAGPSVQQCASSQDGLRSAGTAGGEKRCRDAKLAGGRAADPNPGTDVLQLEPAGLAVAAKEGGKPKAACEPLQLPKAEVRKSAVVTSFATLIARVRAKERRAEASRVEPTAKRQRHGSEDMNGSM